MIKDKSIFIKNIYYMLSYAFTTLNQGGYEDIATEEIENMHNLLPQFWRRASADS